MMGDNGTQTSIILRNVSFKRITLIFQSFYQHLSVISYAYLNLIVLYNSIE